MATTDLGSGTAQACLDFQDFMIRKGYGTTGSIQPWKSAAKQVFTAVEGEDFAQLDIRTLDIDEYLTRFENRSMGKYSADSLAAYRSRFRKAVESYRSYLADPNWKPKQRASPRRANGDSGDAKKARPSREAVRETTSEHGSYPPTQASMITYPFPLKSGQMAQLQLPTQLDKDDVERMTHFLRALVFEQPRQLPRGTDDEAD